MQPQGRYYSLKEVTVLLGISMPTAIQWLKDGRFKGVSKLGNRWVFEPDFTVQEGHFKLCKSGMLSRLVKRPDEPK